MEKENPKVDWYFEKASQWQECFIELRKIALSVDLQEELKWGHPCYVSGKANIVLMHGFKQYCALLFFKGALLKDEKTLLLQQTKNVQAARQMRFSNLKDIVSRKKMIKDYIAEAIAIEKSGMRFEMKSTSEFEMPEEFKAALQQMPALKKSFSSLTPGRQRGYLLYFSSAKQAKTRQERVDKNIDRILEGFGLSD